MDLLTQICIYGFVVVVSLRMNIYNCINSLYKQFIYIYGPVLRLSTPPHGLGPQVVAPIPFYLQAIGSISEVQLRIC